MGLLRGTKLALAGIVGAALAWWAGIGTQLRQYEVVRAALELPVIESIVGRYAVVLDWSVGVFVGVVVADLFGYLGARNSNRNVELSSTLGVGKGTSAVVAGVVALSFADPIFAEFARRTPELAAFVRTYLGGKAGFSFALGIWVGAVVAEVVRL
ncbi:hypothetical protein M0R89_06300 [Halorussus limi]|uniref:Uncharacterized protein n=1 Tax=Halorussus limi TaxID=2938695 RepID=A0A8U0HY88_9EURY|nr:hypothetical protein [Halorussus limi]UPV75671.1 hypothetical protein M0R89_06300 [Halorussus limi]